MSTANRKIQIAQSGSDLCCNCAKDGPFLVGIVLFALCVPMVLLTVLVHAGCGVKDFCVRIWFKKLLRKEPTTACDVHGRVGWTDWKIASIQRERAHRQKQRQLNVFRPLLGRRRAA